MWLVIGLGWAGCGATPAPPAVAASDFTNAEGELVCPVMGDVIASKEAAVGQASFNGTTYWFCCDSCQHRFADAPEVYAEGAFLDHIRAEHDGKSWTCTHY